MIKNLFVIFIIFITNSYAEVLESSNTVNDWLDDGYEINSTQTTIIIIDMENGINTVNFTYHLMKNNQIITCYYGPSSWCVKP
jgi:hypothetical protein